jgi:peroxiredoxin
MKFLKHKGGDRVEQLLRIGEKAPNFTLESTTRGQISLLDFRNNKNVLIAFYPFDFTPG